MISQRPLFLSILSGVLFGLSWPETGGMTCLIFLAFVPLLILENILTAYSPHGAGRKLFLYSYLAFLIWNVISTWWVKNASVGGAVMAIVFNALFMALVFQLYHVLRRKLPQWLGGALLASLWMSFEYLHLRWDLTWPWLTLGNVFANRPWMVQWYEYSGVMGGDVWIFAVNIAVYMVWKRGVFNQPARITQCKGLCVLLVTLLLLPLAISSVISSTSGSLITSSSAPQHIVVVQPNIDPYNEKFSSSYQEQLAKMIELAETKIDSSTNCVVFPETALTENLWENDLSKTYSIQALDYFRKRHPRLDIVIGATSAYQYNAGEKLSSTARKFTGSEEYYDDYNTALMLTGKGDPQKYHKSKFVPGVERMPFPALFRPLEKLAINMGGTSGSLCGQEERTVFVSQNNPMHIAPVICYESVFGEFVTDYIKKGANVIFIITNDGWWGDTPGYHQHLDYARLRAIETRCCIARSANTGTSCFIDPMGKVTQATSWWKPTAIAGLVSLQNRQTFYVQHGDYLARLALALAALLVLYSLLKSRLRI